MKGETKPKILVIDDDREVLNDVTGHLNTLGFVVEAAEDGPSAVALARATEPDLVILDISFPESTNPKRSSYDDIEVLRRLRESSTVPVLMLSATSISSVKVMALSIGADDYITKPFDLQELGARVKAILRRSTSERAEHRALSFHRLTLNPGERRVWKDEVPVNLTGLEFDILYTMARRPRHVFSRERLLDTAWKEQSLSDSKTVDVHIGHIRQKIEDDPKNPAIVVTVRGTGYKFDDEMA